METTFALGMLTMLAILLCIVIVVGVVKVIKQQTHLTSLQTDFDMANRDTTDFINSVQEDLNREIARVNLECISYTDRRFDKQK